MRYVVAMLFAVVGAAVFTLFVSFDVANWASGKMAFDNPDQEGDMNALVYMGTNFLGLVLGWAIGWVVSGPLASSSGQRPQ